MDVLHRIRHAAHMRPHADIAMAAVLYVVTLATTAVDPLGRLDVVAVIVAGVACGALVARRRFPFATFVTSALAAEAYLVHFQGSAGALVLAAPLIALYTVAEADSRRRALSIGIIAWLSLAALHVIFKPASLLGVDNLALAALGGLAVAAGDASRSRRAYLAEVEARARQAEADPEAEAARRVTEERLRIARDLHDMIGHQLAVITVQAGVASHLLDAQPALSREAMAHVRRAGMTALDELGATIGLLRQPDELASPTEPVAGLAGIDELLASFRRSGLRIAERVFGEVRPIAVSADLTAYRVIQESLTNVCRTAGLTEVTVRLAYQPEALEITVDNRAARQPVPVVAPGAGGHGLVGMRERVTAIGGSLRAGVRPDGGFRVSATLPLVVGTQS